MQNFETQEQLLQKRLAQAQAMRDQEFTPAQGQIIGGHFVRPDMSSALIQGLRAYRGMKESADTEQQLGDLQKQKQEAMQGDMSAIIDALRDKPAETVQPLTPNDDEGNVNLPIQMPARAGSINRAYEIAAKSQFPQFQQMGMQGALTSAQKQAELAQQEAQRQKYGQMLKTMTPDEAIAAGVPKEIVSGYYEAKNYGKTKVGRTIDVIGTNGEKMTQQIDEYGNAIGAPIPAYTAPVQVNQGGQVSFVVPKAGVSMPVTMSPSEKDASARGWATVKQGQERIGIEKTKAAKGGSGGLSATAQKELFEADDAVQNGMGAVSSLQKAMELNNKAYSGVGASARATLRSNLPGSSEGADATIAMENIIKDQALTSMKSIFGGNPTEGERAILLDLQASASKTPKQREEILGRAMQAAQRRLDFNKQKADALRGGSYMSEGGAPQVQAAPAGAPKRVKFDAQGNILP